MQWLVNNDMEEAGDGEGRGEDSKEQCVRVKKTWGVIEMLSYEDKIRIFDSIPQLSRKDISNDRVNYIFSGAATAKKVVAQEIALTGNGYIFVGRLEQFRHLRDKRGFINIDHHIQSETELRTLVQKVIESYS